MRRLAALLAAGAFTLTGCSTTAEPAPQDTTTAAEASAETAEATPEVTAAGGRLATWSYEDDPDFGEALVFSGEHDGFDYDGVHILLEAVEAVPTEAATVEQFWADHEGQTAVRFTFTLENTREEDFPLEEFTYSAWGGENLEDLELVGGIMGGEPMTEDLPRQIAAGNDAALIATYWVPDDMLELPVLFELYPTWEGSAVQYFISAEERDSSAP